ncbi:MAG: DUF3309 family protein [Phycisphaerales bacterium]
MNRGLGLIVTIILVLLLIGLLPVWPYSTGWGVGYYPAGGLGLLVIIIILVLLLGGGGRRLP